MQYELAQLTIDILQPFLVAFMVLMVLSFVVSMFRYK